jgi:hypothetical protein
MRPERPLPERPHRVRDRLPDDRRLRSAGIRGNTPDGSRVSFVEVDRDPDHLAHLEKSLWLGGFIVARRRPTRIRVLQATDLLLGDHSLRKAGEDHVRLKDGI